MPKVKLLKTLMGSFSGAKDSIIEVPQYVAKVYVNAGLAERVKPCNCDDCKDGEDCPENEVENAAIEVDQQTADATPKRKRRRSRKK